MSLTPAQRSEILKLHRENVAVKEIAQRFGVHRTTVSRLVKKEKTKRENRAENLIDVEARKRAMIERLVTVCERIMDSFDVPPEEMRQIPERRRAVMLGVMLDKIDKLTKEEPESPKMGRANIFLAVGMGQGDRVSGGFSGPSEVIRPAIPVAVEVSEGSEEE